MLGADGDASTRINLLSSADVFDLSHAEANAIIDAIRKTVTRQWRSALKARNVSKQDADWVSPCFDDDYFEHG